MSSIAMKVIRSNNNIIRNNISARFLSAAASESTELCKTAFFDVHHNLKGKMVEFAGYNLPVQYEGMGVLKEHNHTRAAGCAGLFDVSHMGQIHWYGKDAVKFIEQMVVGDIASLKAGESKLSLIMNDQGGIVDDTVITNAGDYVYMVVNGGCKWKDMKHFNKYLSESKLDVKMEYQEDMQLLALQGKGAHQVVSRLAPSLDLSKMNFMTSTITNFGGIENTRITRCGYTGEDGFEISCKSKDAVQLATMLFAQPEVKPAGLGARDSLRLEAGLCLYGHDLEEHINPVEAGLVWTIGGPKSRRRLEQGFLGAEKFLDSTGKLKPVKQKRVGITGMKAPAREHTEIFTADGQTKIGEITSGGFGPTYGKSLAMGYVTTENSIDGTNIAVSIRGKMTPAQICKMPFVETSYFKSV